jgi:Predicted NTPase (NACHT family)
LDSRNLNLRRAGLTIAILGTATPAVLLPVSAWLSRQSTGDFNIRVGWANILGLTVSAIGVVLVMIERVGALSQLSPTRITAVANNLTREALRQDSLLLAQLLSTDALDSRAAQGNFRLESPRSRQKSANKRTRFIDRNFTEIVDFYLNETRGRMVVLGPPGSGKTVLAVSLTVGLMKRYGVPVQAQERAIPIPCFFNVTSWDPTRDDLTVWLRTQVVERFRVSRKIAAHLIHDGWILPVLDGLDEMDSPESVPHRSEDAVTHINNYVARTPDCHIVVVCRSGAKYYERLIRKIRDADTIIVQDLKSEQVIGHIQTHFSDEQSLNAWEPVFEALRGPDRDLILSTLGTLWRLTASVTFALFGRNPAELLPTPAERAKLRGDRTDYSDRVSRLLMETFLFARLSIYHNHKKSTIPTISRLRTIANLIRISQANTNTGSEITLHEWWKVLNERKTVQMQVFMAWSILHLPLGILGFLEIYGLIQAPHLSRGSFSLIAILINEITIILITITRIMIAKQPTTFKIGTLRSPRRASSTLVGIVISTLLGLASASTEGAIYGLAFGVTSAALLVLMTTSSGLDATDATRPTATLTNDRNFAIVIGVALGAYATFYYVPLYGLTTALMFASMCMLGSILSSSYIRYLAAVYVGTFRGLPFRLARFLSECHSAGILRISGTAYQFRHQELFEYLLR